MPSTTVNIPDELDAALKAIANERMTSKATIVRQFLAAEVAKESKDKQIAKKKGVKR